MRYGHFSDDYKEYVITDPKTPTPWINYISNLKGYCGIVSQTGGGFSFHKDPRDRRITKYRYNNVPVDRPGRYIYIKDEESGEYWSPTWQPVQKELDSYQCHHGLGYTKINSSYNDISSEVLYFVPQDHECEIWQLKLKNNSDKRRTLSIYPYAEFTTWSEPQSRNIQWSLHLTNSEFEDGMVFYRFLEPHPAFSMEENEDYLGDREGYAFMGINQEVADFDTVRDDFLGIYNTENNPAGVEAEQLSNSILKGGIGCAALRSELTLEANEEKTIIVKLGFAKSKEKAQEINSFFNNDEVVEKELAAVKNVWEDYLDNFTVDSPDKEIDIALNVWNQYQCKTTFDWSRYISFYENGEGRGMGTRDSCQDTLAVCSQLPEQVRDRIIQIITTTQFETGDCYHQFFPLGGEGDLKGFSDDHLWIIQMVYAYIAETGDIELLDEVVKYADSDQTDTIYDHLLAALDYTARNTGEHGLPLILTADWNDTLHLWMEAEKPESVLVAELYIYGLKLMAKLARKMDKEDDAQEFIERADKMADIINKECWDGEWYLRGFGSEVIGTKESERAKLFLNTQSWALISGVANETRARKCMESVRKHLSSPEGLKLIWPPFDEYDQTYGLVSRYNIGRKENGIFAHANAWAVVAECILGRGDLGHEYYRNVLPLTRNDQADVLKTEPYVFCQTICSEDSINRGEGANSWLTGTASWMYVAVSEYLLGIKATLDGLKINPSIPKEWDGFTIRRKFRGDTYQIKVINSKENNREDIKIVVDGKELPNQTIKPFNDGKTHQVKVFF